MPTLRIRHYKVDISRLIDLEWSDANTLVRTSHGFDMEFNPFDLEDVRWYHEDYRDKWAVASNPAVERIRRAAERVGQTLHDAIFGDDPLDLAEKIRSSAEQVRIEIVDEVHDVAVPWEMLVDPQTGNRLALTASEFVRTVNDECPTPVVGGAINSRILVVISRPDGVLDIDYWSVAYDLWRSLTADTSVAVEVLRPPTFDALEHRLRLAAEDGSPYAAVHFDGHGIVSDAMGSTARGYLVFESPDGHDREYIDGQMIGGTLSAAGVTLFTMNACRSGDRERSNRGIRIGEAAVEEQQNGQPSVLDEVLRAGVPACVGMRREIYPETATRFFSRFYRVFLGGQEFGVAAKAARSSLHDRPLAAGAFRADSAPIDDWSIPVVGRRVDAYIPDARTGGESGLPQGSTRGIPPHLQIPAMVGRGAEIMQLEREIRRSAVVYIGGGRLSGKSRLATEFARWLSTTSTTEIRVRYIRLSPRLTPDDARLLLAESTSIAAGAAAQPKVDAWNEIVILDQADQLRDDTVEFLIDVIANRENACRIIVTGRPMSLSWLPPDTPIVHPANLYLAERAELGQRWAEETAVPFNPKQYYRLLYFSGGRPGLTLLLLGAAQPLVQQGIATCDEIERWLTKRDWDKIAKLSTEPVFGLPTLPELVLAIHSELVQELNQEQLELVPAVARFNVCCDDKAVVHLMSAIRGSTVAMEVATSVIRTIADIGLAMQGGDQDWFQLDWYVDPLLKLVVSKFEDAGSTDLDGPMIQATAQKAAALMAGFRTHAIQTRFTMRAHLQNIADAMWCALDRKEIEASSHLVEAFCTYQWMVCDVERSSRVLDHALLQFVDGRTGALRPDRVEAGRRVWEQAIRIGAHWPRNEPDPFLREGTTLMPPPGDHYAQGLWLRATGRRSEAARAFWAELHDPSPHPQYSSGDLECLIAEYIYPSDQPGALTVALEFARRSDGLRHPDDSIGKAWSLVTQARLRLMANEIGVVDEVASLLRQAEIRFCPDPEIRSYIASLWSAVLLDQGDLSSATGYLEDAAELMMGLEDGSVWKIYWSFAQSLRQHGWLARSHEYAVTAFLGAMHANQFLATPIREFIHELESENPELLRDRDS